LDKKILANKKKDMKGGETWLSGAQQRGKSDGKRREMGHRKTGREKRPSEKERKPGERGYSKEGVHFIVWQNGVIMGKSERGKKSYIGIGDSRRKA